MDLETRALAQFDSLVKQGEILWQDTAPRYIPSNPFDVITSTQILNP